MQVSSQAACPVRLPNYYCIPCCLPPQVEAQRVRGEVELLLQSSERQAQEVTAWMAREEERLKQARRRVEADEERCEREEP